MDPSPIRHLTSRVEQGVLVLTTSETSLTTDATAETLFDELTEVVQQAGVNRVVLDLPTVRYMSSPVLGSLLRLRRKLLGLGGRIALCGLSPLMIEIFRITRIDPLMEIQPNVAAAIAVLNQAPAGEPTP